MSYVPPVIAVLFMRGTASLAMSSGPITRLMGSVARSCSRRASRSSPSSAADSGVSTNPAAMRLTRIGATSTARVVNRGGSGAGARRNHRQAGPTAAAAGAAHEDQRAAGPDPADGVLGEGHGQPLVVFEVLARLVAVQFGQGRVVRSGARDHDVVDLGGQPVEEAVEGGRVGGVEGRGAARADLGRGPLEALGVSSGQDDLGALGASAAGGLEPDAGAAADGPPALADLVGV